jgi:transposase InsO family protein
VTARITAARLKHFAGPVALSAMLGIPASTIGVVLRREGLPRLADVDRVTGEIVRGRKFSNQRYEHREPGSLLHIDVKKLGRIPKGGGWRVHGLHTDTPKGRGIGWDFVHVAIDDHSRVAYCEVLGDEKGPTCAEFLHRAAQWFHDTHHVTIRRVLTDNAWSYRHSRDWIAVCHALQIKRRFIKPHCPWTNGKAERFNRTLLTEWAYARSWTYNHQRTRALDNYLRRYNTQRGHSALRGQPPISRLAA